MLINSKFFWGVPMPLSSKKAEQIQPGDRVETTTGMREALRVAKGLDGYAMITVTDPANPYGETTLRMRPDANVRVDVLSEASQPLLDALSALASVPDAPRPVSVPDPSALLNSPGAQKILRGEIEDHGIAGRIDDVARVISRRARELKEDLKHDRDSMWDNATLTMAAHSVFAGNDRSGVPLVFGARRRYERGEHFDRDLNACADRFNSVEISAEIRRGISGQPILALKVPSYQIRDAYRSLMTEMDDTDGAPDVHERCEILIAMCASLAPNTNAVNAASSNSESEKASASQS